jgi:hypothetical protein
MTRLTGPRFFFSAAPVDIRLSSWFSFLALPF